MRWRVIGHGPEEDGWREWLRGRAEAALLADIEAVGPEIEAPLLAGEPDVVVVGGPVAGRGDLVRRAAELGVGVIALQPTGPNPDALYQVALLPDDPVRGFVPALALAAHPGMRALREGPLRSELGTVVSLRYEAELGGPGVDQTLASFVGAVAAGLASDSLLGEIEAITATGSEGPPARRIVYLRGAGGRDAEIRVTHGLGAPPSARFEVIGDRGSAQWDHDPWLRGASTLTVRRGEAVETMSYPEWEPRLALVGTLESQLRGGLGRPDLRDGLLAMEVADAVERSRSRGRTVELHRDEISELGSFKAVMASVGCGVILVALALYVLALVLRALDVPGAGLLAWSIVPLLGGYAVLQVLRLAARPSRGRGPDRQ